MGIVARGIEVGIVRQAVDVSLQEFRPLEDGADTGLDDTRHWLAPGRDDFTISCSKEL